MLCPGQDTRYWKPDDIFDVPCQACGAAVEFFKNDTRRRCPRCGNRIHNPRVSLGCAQWCAHAKECLGFDPQAVALDEGTDGSLCQRLLARLGQEPDACEERLAHAVQAVEAARQTLDRDGGDPRVVLLAAALCGYAHGCGGQPPDRDARVRTAGELLAAIDVDADVTEQVCQLVAAAYCDVAPPTSAGQAVNLARRQVAGHCPST
jgi:hypothetical protein